MRVHYFLASLCAVSVLLLVACQKAPNTAPPFPLRGGDTGSTKPTSVSATHVSMSALVELAHLERAIKPFSSIPVTGVECRKTQASDKAQWESTWKCGDDPKVRGRKEILGVERLNYDHATRTLSYSARFETRNFTDLEARELAHTVANERTIKVRFDRASTEAAGRASVAMTSSVVTQSIQSKIVPGSQYQSRLDGNLVRQGTEWVLGKDSTLTFDGALYGLDGERKTAWASGKYTFVSETDVRLAGLGEATCTKPVGTWRLSAVGGGNKFDTMVETSETGGVIIDGSTLGWPNAHCDEP